MSLGRPHIGRGFTLIEMMIVVAIVGIMAAIAMPNMVIVVDGFRAREDARFVASAWSGARGLAYKQNQPVVVQVGAHELTYQIPDFATPPPSQLFLINIPAWKTFRTFPFPSNVQVLNTGTLKVGDLIAFCPSGEFRFIDQTGLVAPGGTGQPVCGLGNIASKTGAMRFSDQTQHFHIDVNAALGSVALRLGD